jgi:two-component system sensor histidine kinase KdpD
MRARGFKSILPGLVWYIAALVGVAAITALIGTLSGRIDPGRLQMSYLLLVLALAVAGGSGPAIVASIASFLAFDWFFVSPVGTLTVGHPDEWFALGLFLTVGITAGSLAAGLKKSAERADARTREVTTLFELSSGLLAGSTLRSMLSLVADRLLATLALDAVAIRMQIAEERDELTTLATASPDLKADFENGGRPDLPSTQVPLLLNERMLGALTAYASPDRWPLDAAGRRLVEAFAAQTALAAGRMLLLEEEKRAEAAEESDTLKSQFIASISHDLRTPITTIKTAVASIRGGADRESVIDAAASVDHEANRLSRLVGDLLEISRIEAGGLPLSLQPENLDELAGACARGIEPALDGRTLVLTSGGDLPIVWIDGPQIARVLTNLLENAIKFSPPASVVRLTLSSREAEVALAVANEGKAIASTDQARIFEKFYRATNGSSDRQGTGLGLAICKGIVIAHGGRIWTDNVPGGVAFYFALPRGARQVRSGVSLPA